MNKRDRKTLQNFFSDGARPTAQHYSDLIESMVNWKDDGFDKSYEMGWRIASTDGQRKALMSFYEGEGERRAVWTLAHGTAPGTIAFHPLIANPPEDDTPLVALSMTHLLRVGVNTAEPAWALDVKGVARSEGRLGVPGPLKPEEMKADGQWKDITGTLEGCHAFEIVAGVGGKTGDGRYSLIHAIAMNAYNPRNPLLNWLFQRKSIRSQTAVFDSYAHRLQLKWETVADTGAGRAESKVRRADRKFNRPYKLRIRTASDFSSDGTDYYIRCHVTRLWFDRFMRGSRDLGVDRDEVLGDRDG